MHKSNVAAHLLDGVAMWVSRRSMHPTHWLICAQVAGCTPQEQWDNIPLYGKLQIFVLVGMLESYGEGASQPDGYVHYMRGGKPGFYPEIKGKGGPGGHFLFNLWDPFNFTTKRTAEQKERGLKCEILNGRAARPPRPRPLLLPRCDGRGDGVPVGWVTPPRAVDRESSSTVASIPSPSLRE